MQSEDPINSSELILVTGSNGFIGSRVVECLIRNGFRNLRCFVRPSSNLTRLHGVLDRAGMSRDCILEGNLLSPEDCDKAVRQAAVIYHLAAGVEKSFPGCVLNSVVTTRNLLEGVVRHKCLKRFVNISSLAVYSNRNISRGGLLDETCELDSQLIERGEAYTYAKFKQDQLVLDYASKYGIPYVIVRPGAVYGPGNHHITARVGLDTFGFFLHLGGSNQIPLTYVENCAQAIMLAGLAPGAAGEVYNIVDDQLPSSRKFLGMYKRRGKTFRSVPVPYPVFYAFCWMWERYSKWSRGQLPPAFNLKRCATYWKGNRYSNEKLKQRVGWKPEVSFGDASSRYFEYVRKSS